VWCVCVCGVCVCGVCVGVCVCVCVWCVCVCVWLCLKQEEGALFVKLKYVRYGDYARPSDTYLRRLSCWSVAFSTFPETETIMFREIQTSSHPDPH